MRRATSRVLPALAALPLAVGLTTTVAASGEPTDPATLAAAAERSAEVPSRVDMYMAMSGFGFDTDGSAPLATGAVHGDDAHLTFDFGAMLGGMMPSGVDLTFEIIIIDETDIYLDPSGLATMMEMSGEGNPFAQLGDGWLYIDTTRAEGFDLGALGAASPTGFFDMVGATTKLAEIGTDTIHGVDAVGVAGEIDLATLAASGGADAMDVLAMDLDELGLGGDGDVAVPFEVWLGDDGYIHRISFTIDLGSLMGGLGGLEGLDGLEDLEGMEELGGLEGLEELAGLFGDMSITMTVENYDFGAADIVIEAPEEYTDVTDEFDDFDLF